jgi:hypothetical protein
MSSAGGVERRDPDREGCKTTDAGVSHVFEPFALGVVCACGRMRLAEDAEGRLTVRETQSEAA